MTTPLMTSPTPATAKRATQLQITRDVSRADWDAFVRYQPDSRVSHVWDWRWVMADALGHETVYLAAVNESGIEGVLPLAWVRSRLFGRFLVSMPFLDTGGPIGTPAARIALAQAARAEAERGRADFMELRCRQACPGLAESHRKVAVALQMCATADATFDAFPSKLRSQIRRAQKNGLEVHSGVQELSSFYEVYAHHLRDLGSPALGKEVFQAIATAFPSSVRFMVVYDGDTPVAGACGLVWRDEFELVWAAARRDAAPKAPNMLLYWACMALAIADGQRVFDFGRCTPGSSQHRFKRQWGADDVELPWAVWSPAEASAPVNKDETRYRAAVEVWRRLPRVVTRMAGPALARLIP
jgi:FemAB-related protein (PEP-CTERM system-associated)